MHQVNTDGLPIGRALKIERVAAGVPLGRVASAVGISSGYLSRIESGQRPASSVLVDKIRVAIRAAA